MVAHSISTNALLHQLGSGRVDLSSDRGWDNRQWQHHRQLQLLAPGPNGALLHIYGFEHLHDERRSGGEF